MGILPHMAAPRHPLAGPVCLVFWADRGPGASCPYGEGPRRALVTFPRWKVTRGSGAQCPGETRIGGLYQNLPAGIVRTEWHFRPGESTQSPLGRFDAPQTPDDSSWGP